MNKGVEWPNKDNMQTPCLCFWLPKKNSGLCKHRYAWNSQLVVVVSSKNKNPLIACKYKISVTIIDVLYIVNRCFYTGNVVLKYWMQLIITLYFVWMLFGVIFNCRASEISQMQVCHFLLVFPLKFIISTRFNMFYLFVDELLKKCEKCLKKSYGENLERLVSLTVR